VHIGIAPHSLRAVPPDALRECVEGAKRADLVIHIHVAEQVKEVEESKRALGHRPVEWLLANFAVDARFCLVHATHVTPQEIDGIAKSGAVVAVCPTTEANLGDGLFPLPQWLAAGGTFAIGSDSHISLSPIEELRWLEYEARLATKHRNVLATHDEVSTGAMLWRHACAAGTRATARNIGAIEAGRRADIVVIDTNSPLFAGRDEDELIDTFVFSGTGHEVRDVMVAGRWAVQEGRHSAETAIAVNYKRAMHRILE